MKYLTMEEYIRTIKNIQPGELSLFLGAGASIQSGVPSAYDMIWDFKKTLYCSANNISEEYYKDLQSETTKKSLQSFFDGLIGYPLLGAENEYSFYFEKCYPTEESRRDYIVSKTSDKKPSIGYLCTGALLNQHIIDTVITTNFDPLIEFGAKSINPLNQIVSISSSLSPQLSITNGVPEIVKMHGDYLYDKIQNTTDELQEIENHIAQHAISLLSRKQLLVIGYSGNDESILNWFENGLKQSDFISKGLCWCIIKNSGISKKVQDLLTRLEESGKEISIVEISNFDDFLYKIYNHKCAKEETIEAIGKTLINCKSFSFSSSERKTPFIKFNAFVSKEDGIPQRIKCAKTSIDGYKSLKAIIKDLPIIGALKGGNIYFVCDDKYDEYLEPHLTGNVREVDFNTSLLNRDNSIELSLIYDLILKILSNISGLQRIGKRRLINVETETIMKDNRYKFYEALLVSLQCNQGYLYLILTPTVEVVKRDGAEITKEERQVLTNMILSQRYNNKFGELLLSWQKTINDSTGFIFSLGNFKVTFEKIAISNGGYRRSNSWPTLEAYEFEEPKMQLSAQCYVNQLKGLIDDGPFDVMFSSERFPIRVALLSQINELKKIYMHLYQLNKPHKAQKVEGYIINYPGFESAYRKKLVLPGKGSPLISTYDNAIESLKDALEYYKVLTSKIDSLLDKRDDFDILVVHIPTSAKMLRQKDGFDLHDAVKLYCANKQIKVQFVEDKSINNTSQNLKVVWGLSTGIFAKSNGELWRPRYFDEQTAFIGISYSMMPNGKYYVGCSQLFDSCGNGMRLIINQLKDPTIIRENPYMSKEDAQLVVGNLLRAYYSSSPSAKLKRVVVHKSSDFQQSEIEGINIALASVDNVELLQIQEYSDWRAIQFKGEYDEGMNGFAVNRGLAAKLSDDKILLWTHGCIKHKELLANRNYYKGGRGIPAPILIKRYQGNSSADLIVNEIMMLTKMNWNSGDNLYKNLPVTIDFSKIVAKMAKQNTILLNTSYDFRYFM